MTPAPSHKVIYGLSVFQDVEKKRLAISTTPCLEAHRIHEFNTIAILSH